MKQPVDHIHRPQLPWRVDNGITECGLEATNDRVLSRADYLARKKDLGVQRSALLTCMTCANTAERHRSWDEDPRSAMNREIEWERPNYWGRDKRKGPLRDELLAIAALIEAHRDEFDAHIAATVGRREWLEQKAARTAKTKSTPRGSGDL